MMGMRYDDHEVRRRLVGTGRTDGGPVREVGNLHEDRHAEAADPEEMVESV